MKLTDKKCIIWDFDGVILNSNKVRNSGFEIVLKDYKKEDVDKLMRFHEENGGLSRYVKFRYFFEEVLCQKITEKEIKIWANKFSEIMIENLVNKNLLIKDSLNFIKENYLHIEMNIASGSDQKELRFLCKQLGIKKYFKQIYGSPISKIKNVRSLLKSSNFNKKDVVLIGDSINDFEAAKENNIEFRGYNNINLKDKGVYIFSFS